MCKFHYRVGEKESRNLRPAASGVSQNKVLTQHFTQVSHHTTPCPLPFPRTEGAHEVLPSVSPEVLSSLKAKEIYASYIHTFLLYFEVNVPPSSSQTGQFSRSHKTCIQSALRGRESSHLVITLQSQASITGKKWRENDPRDEGFIFAGRRAVS